MPLEIRFNLFIQKNSNMKKTFLFLVVLFISVSLFSQNNTTDKEKKDNMGQSIKEVNTYYRDKLKEIKADPAFSKSEKKQQRSELKVLRQDRIHEINDGTAKRKNEIRAERRDERVREKAVKRNTVREKKVRENKGKNN